MRIPLLSIFAAFSLQSFAAPTVFTSSIVRRQDSNAPFNGPVSVTTESTSQSSVGTIVHSCKITLTPVVINGVNAVREDKACKDTVTSSSSGTNNNGNNGSSSSSSGGNNGNTGSSTSSSSGSTTTSAAQGNGNNGGITNPTDVSVLGTSVVTATGATATGSSSASASGPLVIGQSTVSGTATSSANGVSSSSASSGTAAADQVTSPAAASATTAPFVIPGKKIQVLPIGLGVFAGISVIALIVVGLVTYERTKYRKTFRQRKLAEAAAPMGYGGMAERS